MGWPSAALVPFEQKAWAKRLKHDDQPRLARRCRCYAYESYEHDFSPGPMFGKVRRQLSLATSMPGKRLGRARRRLHALRAHGEGVATVDWGRFDSLSEELQLIEEDGDGEMSNSETF